MLALACAVLAPAAPVGAQPPQVNKPVVVELDENLQIGCADGTTLDLHIGGSIKLMPNPNVGLTVFQVVLTYANEDGETWVYHDVGPDRTYLDDDGNLVIEIMGRPGNAFGFSLSGRAVIVVDPETGNVLSATYHGKTGPIQDELACAALS
jgi:hypothetical protein